MSATLTVHLAKERSANAAFGERATAATFIIADTLAVLTAFAITIVLRGALAGVALWPQYFHLAPYLAIIPLFIGLMDLYPGVMLDPVEEFRRLTIAIAVGMSLVVVVTFLFKESVVYSRAVSIAAVPLGVILAQAGRWLVRKAGPKTSWWGIPTVLVGAHQDIEHIRGKIDSQPSIGIRLAATIPADLVHLPARAMESMTEKTVPYALVVVPNGAQRDWIREVERTLWGCKKIIAVPQTMGLFWTGMRIRDCCGVVGLEMRRQLLRRGSRNLKRVIDWILALAAAVFFAPLVIVIALLIKLTAQGSAFYSQERIGERGRTFRAWKFRTMVPDAENMLQRYLQDNPALQREWESDQKLRSDPRVTRIGRFLRKTSLDELPQIWNVVRGEMSFVGPRPIVQSEVAKYGQEFDLYQKVRPGITGLWQISGRSDTTYDDRVAMDVYYVRNWSVWLDIYLLIRTANVVLQKQGAY